MRALIAGRGRLPELVAQAGPVLICALSGSEPDSLNPDLTFRLEHLGRFLNRLAEAGVTEICLAGAIDRPGFDPTALDGETAPLVPVLAKAMQAGDDGALRAIIGLLEARGISVKGAHEIVPDLLAQPGILAGTLDSRAEDDAAHGMRLIETLAPLDVGQACVVGGGQVLGVEAAGGTEWMIKTLPETPNMSDALLLKCAKPGQERRADLPAIGPDTVAQCLNAGLRGIVIRAGDVMILDRSDVIAACNAADMLLWVRP